MLSERPDPWESTEKFKGRMNVKTLTCQDLGDSSIVAGAGAGMRACVSESQSMFETGKGFRQKFTSASVIPLRNAQVLRQELFEKYLLEDCGEAECHINRCLEKPVRKGICTVICQCEN